MTRGVLEVHRTRVEEGIGGESHTFAALHSISQVDHHRRHVDTIADHLDIEVGHIEDGLYGTGLLVDTDLVSDLHRIVEVRTERVAMFPCCADVLVVGLSMCQCNDDTALTDVATEVQCPLDLGSSVPALDDTVTALHDLRVFLGTSGADQLGELSTSHLHREVRTFEVETFDSGLIVLHQGLRALDPLHDRLIARGGECGEDRRRTLLEVVV